MQSFANETVSSDLRVMPGDGGLVMFLGICGADSRVGGFRLAPVVRIPNPTKTDKDPRPVRMGFLCAQAVVQQPNGHQVLPIRHPSHGPCIRAARQPGATYCVDNAMVAFLCKAAPCRQRRHETPFLTAPSVRPENTINQGERSDAKTRQVISGISGISGEDDSCRIRQPCRRSIARHC